MWIAALACTPDRPPPAPAWASGVTTIRFEQDLRLVDAVRMGSTTWALDASGGLLDPSTGAQPDVGYGTGQVSSAQVRGRELWTFGLGGVAAWDGVAWTTLDPTDDHGLDGTAGVARADGTVVWIAGSEPHDCYGHEYWYLYYTTCLPDTTTTTFTWDGAGWSSVETGPDAWLYGAAETADGRLIAVGEDGWIAEWTGAGWSDLARGGATLRAVAADGEDIVAVGDGGRIVRGPPEDLVEAAVDAEELDRVVVGADGRTWALGGSRLWVDDDGWSEVALPAGVWLAYEPQGGFLVGDQDGPTVMAGAESGAWETAWHEPDLYGVSDVWVDEAGAAWLAADEAIARWDGDALTAWQPGEGHYDYAIAGRSADDVLVLAWEGLFAWDGAEWTLSLAQPDATVLWSVAIASDGTAFATGTAIRTDETLAPVLWRRSAGVWAIDPVPLPITQDSQLVAFGADDVVALTDDGWWRFDGTAWTVVVQGLGGAAQAVWGRSADDLYVGVVGRPTGGLVHWDGVALTDVAGAPPAVRDVAGDDESVVVVGAEADGTEPRVAVLRDGAWTELAAVAPERVGIGGGVVVAVNRDLGWRAPW